MADEFVWTPYEIRVLLWHHIRQDRFEGHAAPIYSPTVDGFMRIGLLEASDEGYFKTTDKAAALIDLWRQTPIPVMKWVDPRLERDSG